MKCDSCGAESGEGAVFCEGCGAALTPPEAVQAPPVAPAPPVPDEPAMVPIPSAPPQPPAPSVPATVPAPPAPPAPPVFCTKCGTQNTAQAGFCRSCGTPLVPMPAMIPAPGMMPGAPAAPAPGPSAFARFFASKGPMFALIGATVGLAFILVAAVAVRPLVVGAYKPIVDAAAEAQPSSAQAQLLRTGWDRAQTVLEQAVTVPFLAANLHLPAESLVIPGAAVDLQTPLSLWNGLALFAMALGGFVSVMLAKPATARDAVMQGAAASVPYGVGILIIAAVASASSKMDSSLFGLGSTLPGAVTLSFPYVGLLLVCLVVGSLLGAVVGLAYVAFTSRRPLGDVANDLRSSVAGPIGGAVVALSLALVLSLAALAGIWAYAKSTATAPETAQTQASMRILDGMVTGLSPSLAFYVYDFGHGAPYAWDMSSFPNMPVSTPKTMRLSIVGAHMEDAGGNSIPGSPKYDWWVYLLVLLPVLPLTAGGYLSASWSPGARSLALAGAKVAVPYALGMVALAWLTTMSVGAGTAKFALGDDILFTAGLALAWGGTFGALGGWVKQQRTAA